MSKISLKQKKEIKKNLNVLNKWISLKRTCQMISFFSMFVSILMAICGFIAILAVVSSKNYRMELHELQPQSDDNVDIGIEEEEINGTVVETGWLIVKHNKHGDTEYENNVLRFVLYNDIVITALQLMLYSLFQMIVSLLLVVGIKESKPACMVPWLTLSFQDVLMMLGFIISASLRKKMFAPFQDYTSICNQKLVSAFILGYMLFSIYMSILVWCYMRFLMDSQQKLKRVSSFQQDSEMSVIRQGVPTNGVCYEKVPTTEDSLEKKMIEDSQQASPDLLKNINNV